MKKLLFLLAFVFISTVFADGYTFSNGYYWYNGTAYNRSIAYGYDRYGCRYSYYQYTAAPQVSYNDSDWKVKLLEIAKQRDLYEGKIRQGLFEQASFLQAVKALGLEGNFAIRGYGAQAPSPYPQLQLGSYGMNGSTIYGTGQQQILQAITSDPVDLNILFQQMSRLTQNAQQLAGQGHTDFADLIAKAGNNQAEVAKILAKSKLIQDALKSLQDPNSIKLESRTFSFKIGADGKIEAIEPEPKFKAVVPPEEFQKIMVQDCGTCHLGEKAKGGFNLASYLSFTEAQKEVVRQRLTHPDPKKRMPLKSDLSPGVPLPQSKLKMWYHN